MCNPSNKVPRRAYALSVGMQEATGPQQQSAAFAKAKDGQSNNGRILIG